MKSRANFSVALGHGDIAKDFLEREAGLRGRDNAEVIGLDIGIGSVEHQPQVVLVRCLKKISKIEILSFLFY